MSQSTDGLEYLVGPWDGRQGRPTETHHLRFTAPGLADETPVARQTMPEGSGARKDVPLCTGVFDYFPAALAEVAKLSKYGNDKHNPGEPLHWARGKSMDHADCIARHLVDRGQRDPDTGLSHTVALVWRALALLQEELEARGAPVSRGSRFASAPSSTQVSVVHAVPPTGTE
jgi:hypothetical protein